MAGRATAPHPEAADGSRTPLLSKTLERPQRGPLADTAAAAKPLLANVPGNKGLYREIAVSHTVSQGLAGELGNDLLLDAQPDAQRHGPVTLDHDYPPQLRHNRRVLGGLPVRPLLDINTGGMPATNFSRWYL